MVTSMLEKAIEIEGLLRIIRDGKPQPETYALLNRKAKELANATQSLENQIPNHELTTTDEEQTPTVSNQEPGKETGTSEATLIVIDNSGNEIKGNPESKNGSMPTLIDMTEKLTEETTENKDHEELAEVEEEDVEEEIEEIEAVPNPEASPEEEKNEESPSEQELAKPEATSNEGINEEIDEEDDILLSFEEDEESTEEIQEEDGETIIHIIEDEDILLEEGREEHELDIHVETPDIEIKKNEEEIKERPSTRKQSSLKSAFSLNDRFLYSRELFNGNMKMFDSTLEHIEGIGDYSVAEDYFYNELEWDREKPEVASFMEIIKLKI